MPSVPIVGVGPATLVTPAEPGVGSADSGVVGLPGTPVPLEPAEEPAPPRALAPETPVAAAGARSLLGLLARMWLLREGTGASGSTAIPAPPEAPEPPARAPPPAAVAPSPPVAATTVAPVASLPLPARGEELRPVSGLASFLVEVAGALPHDTSPSPGVAPLPSRQFARIAHCDYPIPEQAVSHNACRRPPYRL